MAILVHQKDLHKDERERERERVLLKWANKQKVDMIEIGN